MALHMSIKDFIGQNKFTLGLTGFPIDPTIFSHRKTSIPSVLLLTFLMFRDFLEGEYNP